MVQNKTAWKHGAARAVKAIFAVLGALTIVFFAFFGGEFSTLKTLNRVEDDANLFTMEYKADYALDRFLKIGASTDTELIEFIVRQVLKGIPLKFDLPNLGCSTFAAKLADGTPIFGRNFDMYDSPALLDDASEGWLCFHFDGQSGVHRIQQRKPSDFSGEGNYDSGRAVCAAGRRERKGLSGRRFTD